MKFKNKAKPIKFSLLVGGRECRSVEDVKRNFDFDSLYDSFKNQNLQKWLSQISEKSLHETIKSFAGVDTITQKIRLYNLFAPEKLMSDNLNDVNVLNLLKKGCINFGDLKNTRFSDNHEIQKFVIDNTDIETINRLCKNDIELLKYYYSKYWYRKLNEQNCRMLIEHKIVTNEDVIMEIASKNNFFDILKNMGIYTREIKMGKISIEMILVKDNSGGDFYIGKYPVTQTLWQAIMGSNPSEFKGNERPVENVSWNACNAFIHKLKSKTGQKFRLPTEAEWKYAARGGTKCKFRRYSGSNYIGEVAWYAENSDQATHPVGQKKPNELGIYDMSGNVWEWCEDVYEKTNTQHVLCGGAWTSNDSSCAVDFKGHGRTDSVYNYFGLRLVMDA